MVSKEAVGDSTQKSLPLTSSLSEDCQGEVFIAYALKLRACSYESLTSFVSFVLLEVLDEAGSEILSLLLPLCAILIGVARIENTPSHAVELCGNL